MLQCSAVAVVVAKSSRIAVNSISTITIDLQQQRVVVGMHSIRFSRAHWDDPDQLQTGFNCNSFNYPPS